MHRNVEINIPVFIGVILLVAAISALLIWGVNTFTENMLNSKEEMDTTMQQFDQLWEGTPLNSVNNLDINQIIYWFYKEKICKLLQNKKNVI